MHKAAFIFLSFIYFSLCSQSFEKGTKVFYFGAAASSRYLDINFFKETTEEYYKSPIIALGLDYCFSTLGEYSNSHLGIGPYISFWHANHHFTDSKNKSWENRWTDVLASVRLTHHLTYFIRKRMDVCSGIIIGARYKLYHYIKKQDDELPQDYYKNQIFPAIGITATCRYYFYRNTGIFIEGSLGYKTDLMMFGLCYKIH